MLPFAVVGIPSQFYIGECPFPASTVSGALARKTLVQTGLPLELHEPRGGFWLAACCRLNPADEFAMRPVITWIGEGSRGGQVAAELL